MIYDTGNLPEGDRLEVERGENCVIYNLSNAGGTGKITQYDVYDSVNVLYSDLHLTRFGEGSYGEKYLMIEKGTIATSDSQLKAPSTKMPYTAEALKSVLIFQYYNPPA